MQPQRIAFARIAMTLAILAVLAAVGNAAEPLQVWTVDPHVKIFRDATPQENAKTLVMRAARNEYEPGQIVVRSDAPLENMRVELSSLQHSEGKGAIAVEKLSWNFVGFVPIEINTHDADAIWLRKAPCEIPDTLLEERSIDLPANTAQSIWLTVFVPKDAEPGLYRGEAIILSGDARVAVPVELTVDPFTLPDDRHLLVTNWMFLHYIIRGHKVEQWSDAHWAILQRYAENLAAHRQNVILTPWQIIAVVRRPDGKLAFDYKTFDRYVEIFQRAGVDYIEITHVAGAKNGWGTEIVLEPVTATDEKTGKAVKLGPDEGLRPLLADLERHLTERGWLEKSMIHIGDEPSMFNLDSWLKASDLVHESAPKLRRIDAIETTDFKEKLEIWVPKLNNFDQWRQTFESHRNDGQFWFYVCCDPYGNHYPNRFLDYPLSRVRVLHWINYTEQLSGFLHWGLSAWKNDPFGPPNKKYPPGDSHVLYPGKEGPINSIRWEIERESIEDFEYLWLLTEKTAEVKKRLGPGAQSYDPRERAMELARRVVRSISDCEIDPSRITAVRNAIADEIIAIDQSPLVLVKTDPPEGTTLTDGPALTLVYVCVEPGATVKINGKPARLSPENTFRSRSSSETQIEVTLGDKQKTLQRSFPVRK